MDVDDLASSPPRSPSRSPHSCLLEIPRLLKTLSHDFLEPLEAQHIDGLADRLRHLRLLLLDSSSCDEAKDAFRASSGFELVINLLRSSSGIYQPNIPPDGSERSFFDYLNAICGVLWDTLSDHLGNQRYFVSHLEPRGWLGLQQALTNTGVLDSVEGNEEVFGLLIAFAFKDEALVPIFRSPKSNLAKVESADQLVGDGHDFGSLRATSQRMKRFLTSTEILWNPEICPLIFDFWLLLRKPHTVLTARLHTLSLSIINVLTEALRSSQYNAVAMHSTGITSVVVRNLLTITVSPEETACLKAFCLELLRLGVDDLDGAAQIFGAATCSNRASELLLEGMKSSDQPPHFVFDLSLYGYASLELSELRGAFQPDQPSNGYTFFTWLRIQKFDVSCHTTLFGAFDASQTCFLLIYLERRSHQIVLQTSSSSARPSVYFKSTQFNENTWYHVAIAHESASGCASLFVNGELCERVICNYPFCAPITNSSKDHVIHGACIQAFVGTPHDLSPRLGRGVLSSQWALASAHLLSVMLPDELILVCCKLGPSYHGNFQDCLGSFQTYYASATLNLRNELLHPGKEDSSVISEAVRSNASKIIPEQHILLSLSPWGVYESQDPRMRGLLKTKAATCAVQKHKQKGIDTLIVNSVVPSLADALVNSHSVVVPTGGLIIYNARPIRDACWRFSGCVAFALKMATVASTDISVIRGLHMFLELIQNSWRNSEAVERENGFGVLGLILRSKLGVDPVNNTLMTAGPKPMVREVKSGESVTLQLLRLILEFVGYDIRAPERSIIINPLAYRTLVVDFDLWRRSDPATQELYLSQFTVFGLRSNNSRFNAKRLNRMSLFSNYRTVKSRLANSTLEGILKKLIDGLKTDQIGIQARPLLAEAIKTLLGLERKVSAEDMRSISLYIAYALYDPDRFPFDSAHWRSCHVSRDGVLSQHEIGVTVLSALTSLLCQDSKPTHISKFAKTVTNKWLLHLLAVDDRRVVVFASSILARLLVTSGLSYITKFDEITGGFLILRKRLRKWWYVPEVWTSCLAVLFGMHISDPCNTCLLDAQYLPQILLTLDMTLSCPKIWNVLVAMLTEGLEIIKQGTGDLGEGMLTLQSFLNLLFSLQEQSKTFRDFARSSSFSKDLLSLLFIADPNTTEEAVGMEKVVTHDESVNGSLDVAAHRPMSGADTQTAAHASAPHGQRITTQRSSSWVVVPTDDTFQDDLLAFTLPLAPTESYRYDERKLMDPPIRELVQNLAHYFVDQILRQRDFSGLGLFLKAPFAPAGKRAFLNSFITRQIVAELNANVTAHTKPDLLSSPVRTPGVFCEPKVLNNITRFFLQAAEAISEGWLVQGIYPLLQLISSLWQYLQSPGVKDIKSVRLCSPMLSTMQSVFRRLAVFGLCTLKLAGGDESIEKFLQFLSQWQNILLLAPDIPDSLLGPLCYLLCSIILNHQDETVRYAAITLWQRVSRNRSLDCAASLVSSAETNSVIVELFWRLQHNEENLLDWIIEHRENLERALHGRSRSWLNRFISGENNASQQSSRARELKRKERLNQWHLNELAEDHAWTEHESATMTWNENIHASELLKTQRARQDQKDNYVFLQNQLAKHENELARVLTLSECSASCKWSLDEVEGRSRMRLRLVPTNLGVSEQYQPKRGNRSNTEVNGISKLPGIEPPGRPIPMRPHMRVAAATVNVIPKTEAQAKGDSSNIPRNAPTGAKLLPLISTFREGSLHVEHDRPKSNAELDDFEFVSNPREDQEDNFDTSRKVMRSLQRGEQVVCVYNVSRIRGLEACESLLIVGKNSLYLLADLFQRSDGEILSIWQAPEDERDPYTRIISGRETSFKDRRPSTSETEVRHWPWPDIISISKRQFLFRDVALELFFRDGRSFLINSRTPQHRDQLYSSLSERANHAESSGSAQGEKWRFEQLQNSKADSQSVGDKIASVFSISSSLPATMRWMKGESSNFHYLMHINTMAGRTFNDLTQYPVFPWVLADYTSEELDLADPRVFRDLTKPMGCQTPERESAFKERYKSFKEMSDERTPAFHYGTHYSSAMIVTSYMIRLQPFVQSYLLLQGGSFDHADRLFYSIEKAWQSASKETMTDVRELTPEFYYLPDFLRNVNRYNFGAKEGTGEVINDVKLPPWAKGDPEIFIAMQRRALESPYVTQNLHSWIDLVFGFKQRGGAAVEATNCFHYLSYAGGKNLEEIKDPLERLATIGIIHNFGQTPQQVFSRPHEQRHGTAPKPIDFRLATMTAPKLRSSSKRDAIFELFFSVKQQRLLRCGPYQSFMPTTAGSPNVYVQWGNVDGSLRFYEYESNKLLGISEQLHQDQISTVISADSKTLVTASIDCTVSVWTISGTSDSISLQMKAPLLGHRHPVSTLAVSKSLSTLLSCSTDGTIILWDLNTLNFVRQIRSHCRLTCAQLNNVTGHIFLCDGQRAIMYTINGIQMLDQVICDVKDDSVTTCSFFTASGNEWIGDEHIFTGHKSGTIKIWILESSNQGKWQLTEIRRLNHMQRLQVGDPASDSPITCVYTFAQKLLAGDREGRVFEWEWASK